MTVHNFTSWTNADWHHDVTVTDAQGAPRDLTGAAVFLNVERRDGTAALKLSLGGGLTIIDAAAGEIAIEVPQRQMKMVPAGLYLYDLIVQTGTERINVLSGSINLRQGVTEWPTVLAAILEAEAGIVVQAQQTHKSEAVLFESGDLLVGASQSHHFQSGLMQMGDILLAALKIGAQLEVDFSANQALIDGSAVSIASLVSCSRSTVGCAESEDGDLIEFAAGGLRITDKGLCCEGARTNSYIYSDRYPDFNQTTTPAPTNNTETAPNGTTTAWKFPAAATGSCQRNLSISADSDDYTFSVYARPLGIGARLRFVAGIYTVDTVGVGAYIFDNDSFEGTHTLNVEKFANGWYRFSRTFTNDGTGTVFQVRIDPQAGYEDKVAIWGIQVEKGSFPSSYIRTDGTAATRAADNISFSDKSWYNAGAGTFLINFRQMPKYSTDFLKEDVGHLLSMGSNPGPDPDDFWIYGDDSGEGSIFGWRNKSGATDHSVFASIGRAETHRQHLIVSYQNGQPFKLVGGGKLTDPVAGDNYVPTAYDTIAIGQSWAGGNDAFGWMEEIVYWPTAKSGAEIKALGLLPSAGNVHILGDSFVASDAPKELRHTMMEEYRVWTRDGVGDTSLADQKIRFDATPDYYDRILVIWEGGLDGDSVAAIPAIDAMVAHLTHDIWAMVEPDPSSGAATPIKAADIAAIKSHIETTYGTGHWIPTLAALQATNDGSSEDLSDVAAGIVPRSLRSDSIHLNEVGRAAANGEIKAWLEGV